MKWLAAITMTEVGKILVAGMAMLIMAAFILSILLFVVGETVEHFTP